MTAEILLTLGLAIAEQTTTPPPATAGASIEWFYDAADLAVGPIALFLVCLDAQPTATCARVEATTTGSVPDPAIAGRRWWRSKLPPLLAGAHTVVVQACTEGAAECSGGASLKFTFQAITDPGGLRLVGGGGK